MNYDAVTDNGIRYFKSLYNSSYKYMRIVEDLNELAPQYHAVLAGKAVQAYTIGSRNITRNVLTAGDLRKLWDNLMAEKDRLESGRTPRRAVAVVPHDW